MAYTPNTKFQEGDVVRESGCSTLLTVTHVQDIGGVDPSYQVKFKSGNIMEAYESELVLVRRYNATLDKLTERTVLLKKKIEELKTELAETESAAKLILKLEGE